MFKRNINTIERVLRLILAIILLLYAIWQKSWIVLLVALFVFFEVIIGWCAFYQLIGKNSCPLKPDEKSKDNSKDDTV